MADEHTAGDGTLDEPERGLLGEEDEREAKRKSLKEFLSRTEPVWKDEDHPDIVAVGAAEWGSSLEE